MFFYLLAGFISACAILFLLAKIGMKRVLNYDIIVDVVSTLALIFMFAGTFAGMMAAVIGGCLISMTLYLSKKAMGYKKPRWKKYGYTWEDVK